MGWLSGRREERERRERAQLARIVAAQQRADQLAHERLLREVRGEVWVWPALYAAIVDEVDRRQAAGHLPPLKAAIVLHETLSRATKGSRRLDDSYSEVLPAAVREIVTGVISELRYRTDLPQELIDPTRLPSREYADQSERRKALALARARDRALAKDRERKAVQERAKKAERERARKAEERARKAEQEREREEAESGLRPQERTTVSRSRAEAEKAAPGLLARAGLPSGKNELEIATLLLLREEEVTPERIRHGVTMFEEIYEAHVRSFKATGGQTSWPSAGALIRKLFSST
ncbi:hypothetical protein ACFW23_36660 [Streptomyces rochei]|uniref:hypothetical protein n=1 Tax=Streptomyces rochei TaxID=1928 RepID=UPI0036B66A3B